MSASARLVVACGLLCLVFSAPSCGKNGSVSPAEAKRRRQEWDLKTTVEAYDHAGFANSAWNDPARKCLAEFARSRSATDTNEWSVEVIATNAAAAIDAGCNDPLVNYLFIRFSMSQTNNKEAFVTAFCKTAREINSSSYPPVRKFYAAARAVDQIFYTYGTNSPTHPEEGEMFSLLNNSLPAVLADKTTPAQEAYEVATLILQLTGGSEKLHQRAYEIVEKPLFANWPSAYTTWYLKGNYYIHLAWKARGSGYADTVSPEGWQGFSSNLAVAQDAFEHAWKLDPKQSDIADQMITVVLGQGGGRNRMELWFNRAMKANTNDYFACKQKLYYLEPKWYGSDDEQLTFGRECLHSTNWGGRVPLALVDAHDYINRRNEGEDKTNYWKRPEVWSDVQAAYDRFFELNPDATGWYHNYALYAYRAEQWDKLNELLPKLGPVNYSYFGGKEQFDKMAQLAREHAGK
jgi:hypothetical protein